jgi:hypothetical protein
MHAGVEVPLCPGCRLDDTAVREKVLRGDAEVVFWCCSACGTRWRERPHRNLSAPSVPDFSTS